ncbi:MAG: hypothetical protein WBD22_05970 [Pyrinomonadaceae bacterium]
MDCTYHIQNVAVVNCNGCGKPLCPACDHRIKGFPYCQDCIVHGVELLRNHNNSSYAPFVRKRTSPFFATVLSLLCPGLGAAYNGQTLKALVYFAVFVGLFQLAILTGGTPLFVLGFIGMWLFSALDSWRTAQMIRSGVTPDVAEDILVKRFSGNPKIWGIVLAVLGGAFLLQSLFNLRFLMRGLLPIFLIGLGIYLVRGYIFKKKTDANDWNAFQSADISRDYGSALSDPRFSAAESASQYTDRTRTGTWRSR